MKFGGGGATRKTAPDSDLTLCHFENTDNLSPKTLKKTCLNSFDEKIECHPELDSGSIKIRKDSGSGAGMTEPSHVHPSCHSELDSESINADNNRLRLGGRSDESGKITNSSFRHPELAAKSFERESKRDFMLLPCDSETMNEHKTFVMLNLFHHPNKILKQVQNDSADKSFVLSTNKQNILRPAIRSDEGSRMSRTQSRHSDESQSLSMPIKSSDSEVGMTKTLPVYQPCHSELVSESLNKGKDSGSEAGMTKMASNNLRPAVRNDKSGCKAAFTMAEVLITLGIIGIVAAMTLPTIINRIQEKVLEARFRKVYNILNVACEKTVADLGYVPSCYSWIPGERPYPDLECDRQENGDCNWYYPDGDMPSDYYGPRNDNDCRIFEEALMKNLNVIQQCPDAEDDGCTVHYKGSDTIMKDNDNSLSDEEVMAATAGTPAFREENLNKLPAIVLIDGITFIDPQESRYINTLPIIDINGKRGPNKWGYDLFVFGRVGSTKKGIYYIAGSHPVEKGGRTCQEMIKKLLER